MSFAFIVFGGLSVLVVNKGWDYVKILSGIVMAAGLYTVASSIKLAPASEGRRLTYKPPGIVIGMALMSGAALYYASRHASWFFFCLILPMVIGAVRAGLKSKKQDAA